MTKPKKAKKWGVCAKQVADRTGFHFFRCKNTAKYLVEFPDGSKKCYCGKHIHGWRDGRGYPTQELPKDWQTGEGR